MLNVQGYTAYEAVRDDIHFLDLILDTSSFRFSCIHINKVHNSSHGIDINDPGSVCLLTRTQSVSIDENIAYSWGEQGATALLPRATDGRRKLLERWAASKVAAVRSIVRTVVQTVVQTVYRTNCRTNCRNKSCSHRRKSQDFCDDVFGALFSFKASPGEGAGFQNLALDLYEASFVI
jgi:hypothetical protein